MSTSVDARAPHERLQDRLADPQTVESLNRLLDHVEVIAFTAEALEGFLRRAETVTDSVAHVLGDARRLATHDGASADFVARLPQLMRLSVTLADFAERPAVKRLLESDLLDRLARPETLAAIEQLVGKLEVAAFALDALDGFLRRGDQIADSMAAGAAELKEIVPRIDGAKVGKVAAAMPDLVDAGTMLIEAGMFEPRTVNVLAGFGRTVADSHEAQKSQPQPSPLGLVALFKLLKDPETQRVLAFAIDVAKRYSRTLK